MEKMTCQLKMEQHRTVARKMVKKHNLLKNRLLSNL
jgi:hypothetical protein